MSVIEMLGHARTEGADPSFVVIAVPAVLWGITVVAWVVTRRRRTLGLFVAAVALGGFGLFIGVNGLIELRRVQPLARARGEGCFECIEPGLLGLAGVGLLLIATVMGLVALFLGRRGLAKGEPPKAIRYYTRWRSPEASVDSPSGGWVRGPDFSNLNAARKWAQASARSQTASVVKIYSESPTETKVVETVQASIDTDP